MTVALPEALHEITSADLELLGPHLEVINGSLGDIVWREGEPLDWVCIVETGEVELTWSGIDVGVARAGDVVGAAEVVAHQPAGSTATVVSTDATLLAVRRAGWNALRAEHHAAARRIEAGALRFLARSLRYLDGHLSSLARGEVVDYTPPKHGLGERLMRFLAGRGGLPDPLDAEAVLLDSDLFEGVDVAAMDRLVSRMDGRRYGAGEAVFTEGTSADELYFLVEGEVDVLLHVYDNRFERVATLSPGAMFGMTSLLGPGVHGASTVARTDVALLVLSQEAWVALDHHADDPAAETLRLATLRALARLQLETKDKLLRYTAVRHLEAMGTVDLLYRSPPGPGDDAPAPGKRFI